MTTIIEVVDSAVKIGLGALISGVATYLVTSSRQKSELKKDILLRHRELIEKSSLEIESFTSALREILHISFDCSTNKISKEELDEKNMEFRKFTDKISNAKAFLRLVGANQAEELLSEYYKNAIAIKIKAFENAINKKWLSLEVEVGAFNKEKVKIFYLIQKAYSNVDF
jgi:hypothetical protein